VAGCPMPVQGVAVRSWRAFRRGLPLSSLRMDDWSGDPQFWVPKSSSASNLPLIVRGEIRWCQGLQRAWRGSIWRACRPRRWTRAITLSSRPEDLDLLRRQGRLDVPVWYATNPDAKKQLVSPLVLFDMATRCNPTRGRSSDLR